MTQEVITDIKRREKEEDPSQYMSTVAQHFIDNNPDITWRAIIDALLDHNEVSSVMQVLISIEYSNSGTKGWCKMIILEGNVHFSDTCVKVCRTVKKVLRNHYSQLKDVTESCLQNITDKMYAKGMINHEVLKKPTFYKVEREFSANLSISKDETVLEKMCSAFLHCLMSVGGPAKSEAIALANDWKHEVLSKHKLHWSLMLKETEHNFSDSNFEFSSEDKVAVTLTELHRSFPSLFSDIRKYYDECGLYKLKEVARWISDYLGESGLTHLETFDDLFDTVRPPDHFLNCDLIEDLTKEFPVLDDKVQKKLNDYTENLNNFERSTELKDMKSAIKKVPLPKNEASSCKITIKLTGEWKNVSIDNLWKLMRHLFGRDKKRLGLIDIDEGSITVLFIAPSSLAQSLIDKVQGKVGFMHHLGIFQLVINSQILLDRNEDAEFNFEDSLLRVIKHIDSGAEYKRIALLLIEFEVQLNYQNNEGETALTLASEGGHIEVFMSLLKGADSFVQLPEKEGHIGLNSLACTALSKHIHNSIGGDKIIPQPGTCVGDMLEWAVRERGVSDSVYKLFVSVIEKKLRERFQWLKHCFQAFDNKFVDTTSGILVNTALVTEARCNFHCYIEEETKCDNVHQLLQLLQPHYSYLNINLLNIACTILEPIKEMVDSYNTKLKTFKDTTTLSELVMMTSTKEMETNIGDKCSKLILKLNRSWGSRTITELNKMEAYFLLPISSFLNLIEMQKDGSSFTCTYLIPASQFQPVLDIVIEKSILLHKIGVYEIFVDIIPVLMEDEDESFKFEDALQKAHQDNDEDVLFFLIELNVSLSSASDIVTSVNNIELEKQLSRLDNVLTNIPLENIIFELIKRHEIIAVKVCLGRGCDINYMNDQGMTFLMAAVFFESFEIVQMLLNEHTNVDIRNCNGDTALMIACKKEKLRIIKLLLSKDPDIDIQGNDGWTALMVASDNGYHQVVELLLSKDPNINIRNNDGGTALMVASCHGKHQVVELLLSKDPDINIQDNVGWTALMLASRNGHHQVVELLLSKDPDINIQDNDGWTALILASANGHHQVVELLLSKDPDIINIQNNNGVKALILASGKGHHQIVELLLSKDPDINIQDNNGVTALMFASFKGHHQVVELLLSKDPDINIQDNNDGMTALMHASAHGHHQVVELLLSKDPYITIQNNDGWTALMLASRHGHHQIVELLLSKGADISIQNNDGWTVLMGACGYGHHQVVELLLSKDPNITIQNNDGWTALMLASRNGHHQVVELLLSKDADITIQNNDGWTALILASRDGHHQVVELLLSKDADITIQNNDGWTALMLASRDGHHQIVEQLLSKDADITIQNNDGLTALMFASDSGHHQIVELLLSKDPDINIQDNNGVTALMFASFKGHHQVVELLLSKDPDINIQDNNDGVTALMLASAHGHHQVVELLLSKDPYITIQNNDGWTALMLASRHGHHQIVELLLSKGADISIQNNDGWTVLMGACGYGHHQVVELILSKDPNINIQNNDGLTALMLASAHGHHQVVELLLSKDPDINIQNNDGWTALMLVSCQGYHKVFELILSKDADINIQNNDGVTALMLASVNGYHQVVELLLSKDADINIQNNNGWTALMLASVNGHHQVVELLLSKDADINIQKNNGWTALMLASFNGNYQVVELLLSKDPDINIQNNDGATALMLASFNGNYQVVELLLSKDADINIQNNVGMTALMLASRNGYHQVVELLLSKDPDINIINDYGWTALMFASTFGHHQVVELLLSNRADINIQDNNGITAVTCALLVPTFTIQLQIAQSNVNDLLNNQLKVLELLLDSHPNLINTKFIEGRKLHSLAVAAMFNNFEAIEILMRKCDLSIENIISAFTEACYKGHSSIMILLSKKLATISNDENKLLVAAAEGDIGTLVSMLFEVGMSPDTSLVGGITPLMIAALCGHIDIVDTLIQAGADVNKTNDEGYTALDIVENIESYNNRDSIKELLITHSAADPFPADPVSTDPVPAGPVVKKRQTSFVRVLLQSMLDKTKSFMIKTSNPIYMKQKVSTASFRVDYMPTMTASSLPVLVC